MLQSLPKLILTLLLIITIKNNLSAANNINVYSSFEPKILTLGQRSLLNITVNNNQNSSRPILPKIDGLIIEYLGVSQTIQISNGNPSMTFTNSFTVTPQKAGNFSIPPFEIEIEDKKYPVASSELTVTEKNHDSSDNDPLVTLEVSINENQAHIGQMIPITITLYASTNISLGARFIYGPAVQGKQFMDYGFKENAQKSIANINNLPKQTFVLKTFLTPLETGNTTLQYKATLQIQKSRTRNSSRGFFHSNFVSLFDDILPTVEEIDIESPPIHLSISPLPTDEKPHSFTGAIGHFTLLPLSLSSQEAEVGDPLILKVEIKGTGNLERITPPIFATDNNWKTCPLKPTINAIDASGFTGNKIFEYIIVPQSDNITKSPGITFSFFDPQSGQYIELTPDPISIKIIPSTTYWSNSPTLFPISAENNTLSEPGNPQKLLTKESKSKTSADLHITQEQVEELLKTLKNPEQKVSPVSAKSNASNQYSDNFKDC